MAATILICDDEQPLRALVRAALAGCGYTFVEALDGDEALARARSARPELIILDVVLPGRTGWQVLAELRADPRLAHVPVLLVSARPQHRGREAALAAGADRYLSKPFALGELTAAVADLLGSRDLPSGHPPAGWRPRSVGGPARPGRSAPVSPQKPPQPAAARNRRP